MNYKISYRITVLLLLISIPLFSQVTLQLSTEQEYNSNPFRSRIAESSFISGYDFTAALESGSFGLMYNGTLIKFDNLSERNFYYHLGGFWLDFENSAMSLSVEQRINDPLYSYFDYFSAAFNYEYNAEFWDASLNLYPSLTYTSYKNLSILDNMKSTFSFTFNKPFETGTTIILGGAVNNKIYTQPNKTDLVQILDESNNPVNTLIESQNASSLTQLSGLVRIAQSITPTTGLAFQFTTKKIVSGLASSIKNLNLTYGDESEIFDDPVNTDGTAFLAELTQILFDDLQIKLGYYRNNKTYPSQGTYDVNYNYNTNATRTDTQNIFSFSVQKSFPVSDNLSLDLGLKYYYINNSSNSFWFKYKANSASFNIGLSF